MLLPHAVTLSLERNIRSSSPPSYGERESNLAGVRMCPLPSMCIEEGGPGCDLWPCSLAALQPGHLRVEQRLRPSAPFLLLRIPAHHSSPPLRGCTRTPHEPAVTLGVGGGIGTTVLPSIARWPVLVYLPQCLQIAIRRNVGG